jgi:hypothetical protein
MGDIIINVNRILQQGPTCGIIALIMALDYYKKSFTVNQLLQEAQAKNLTRSGEFFSAYNLCTLGSNYADIEVVQWDINVVREALSANKLILVAYLNI